MSHDPETNGIGSRERARLRGLGQRLETTVHVGQEGIKPSVVAALQVRLAKTDLVKVRFAAERPERQQQVDELAAAVGAACVGTVGRTALYFRALAPPSV